ncbi:MAG: hypothetical protein QNL12_01875 [Acidimicrobiia bacterium]|nr:hypothetical protein [Acidimicrobiia bacterium]
MVVVVAEVVVGGIVVVAAGSVVRGTAVVDTGGSVTVPALVEHEVANTAKATKNKRLNMVSM